MNGGKKGGPGGGGGPRGVVGWEVHGTFDVSFEVLGMMAHECATMESLGSY